MVLKAKHLQALVGKIVGVSFAQTKFISLLDYVDDEIVRMIDHEGDVSTIALDSIISFTAGDALEKRYEERCAEADAPAGHPLAKLMAMFGGVDDDDEPDKPAFTPEEIAAELAKDEAEAAGRNAA